LINTVLFPDELSEYELRYANQLMPLTFSSYMDGSFQQSMDAALGDQVHLSSTLKKLYNQAISGIYYELFQPFMTTDEMKFNYYNMESGSIFNGDFLMPRPYDSSRCADIDAAAEKYNEIFSAYPDVEFYFYYVERPLDIDFVTNEKAGFSDRFFERLELPEENMACFLVDNFEAYSRYFYKTDHHWKHTGSYKGYIELTELLSCSGEPICPKTEVQLPGVFHGSAARGDLSCYGETFTAYVFDYPQMMSKVDGVEEGYGSQDWYIEQQQPVKAYGYFYGLDRGEVFFSTGNTELDKLLIIGDSYDNAIIKLLATHFNETYSVDPRNYEVYMYKPFSLNHYLDEYGIDKVLFIGNFDTLCSPEFYLEG